MDFLNVIDQDDPYQLKIFLLEQERIRKHVKAHAVEGRARENDAWMKIPTMLYHACKKGKLQVVKYFLETLEVSAHLRIMDGSSCVGPIFKVAVMSGNMQLVSYLYETHCVDIESVEKSYVEVGEETALSIAAAHGHEIIFAYLLSQGANPNPKFSQGNILSRALRSKNLSIIASLVERGVAITREHIYESLSKGDISIVEYFFLQRPDISAGFYPGPFGSMLSLACIALRSGSMDVIQFLKRRGKFDLFEEGGNAPYYAETRSFLGDRLLWTLLLSAVTSNNIAMMHVLWNDLVFRGRAVCDRSSMPFIFKYINRMNDCNAALKWIAFFKKERLIPMQDDALWEIVDDAARALDETSGTEDALRRYCAIYNLVCLPYMRNLICKIADHGLQALSLTELFQTYNRKTISNQHIFYKTVQSHIVSRNIEIEQLVNEVVNHPECMTEALCYYSHFDIHREVHSFMQILYDLGADINQENIHGIVPIHVALGYGYNSIVQFYIDRHADVSKCDEHGRSARQRIDVLFVNSTE